MAKKTTCNVLKPTVMSSKCSFPIHTGNPNKHENDQLYFIHKMLIKVLYNKKTKNKTK